MRAVDERAVLEVLKRLEVGRTYNIGSVAVVLTKSNMSYNGCVYSLHLNNHVILTFTKPTKEFVIWEGWVIDFDKFYDYAEFILTDLCNHLAEVETVQSTKYIENATRKIEDIGI